MDGLVVASPSPWMTYQSPKGEWSGSHIMSPEWLKLESSKFVYRLAISNVSLRITNYPHSERGQGHVSHFKFWNPNHISGIPEARHFKIDVQNDTHEY